MTQFLRDQASDNEEVVTPIMLDGTYLSRNLATFGPLTFPAAVCLLTREPKEPSKAAVGKVHKRSTDKFPDDRFQFLGVQRS